MASLFQGLRSQAYPCQASGESPFVLMFGRDAITPFAKLLEPAPRYWGDHGGQLKNGLVEKTLLTYNRECEKSKGTMRSHRNHQTEK